MIWLWENWQAPAAEPPGLRRLSMEVSRLQQDASKAVSDIATGKTDNVDHVMTAVEKSDLAFKTLLAIRAKLMDAYDEIKGIAI
jgi:flagellar hook-basal body complex protein FliE